MKITGPTAGGIHSPALGTGERPPARGVAVRDGPRRECSGGHLGTDARVLRRGGRVAPVDHTGELQLLLDVPVISPFVTPKPA